MVFPWINLKIENGKKCFFWHSNWSPYGKLKDYLSEWSPISSGIPENATLSDLWTNGHWRLPSPRSESLVEVHAFLSTISLSHEEDSFYWSVYGSSRSNGAATSGFSTSEIYGILKQHKPEVEWCEEVWFSGAVPRHSFLAWLFVLNRCPTRDRLLSWNIVTDPLCLLCHREPESRSHIFFSCEYSWSIWNQICRKIDLPLCRDWDSIMLALRQIRRSSTRKRLSTMAWQATMYVIWTERNSRLHRSTSRSAPSLLSQIDLLIRNKASSLRLARPRFASHLLQLWFGGSVEPPPLNPLTSVPLLP